LLCGAFMVRGAFHQDSGLAAAVAGAVARLDQGRINAAPEALLPDA
jgi:hypothetical protein